MARPVDPKSESSCAAWLCEQTGKPCDKSKVKRLKRAGIDPWDLAAVLEYWKNSQRSETRNPEPKPETGTNSETAINPEITAENIDGQIEELRKLLLGAKDKRDAETIDIKIRGLSRIQGMLREQGKYILAAGAETEGMKFGLAAKHMWEEIEDSLPPMLDGLSALQMKTKLREFAAARILELHEFFSE